MRTCLNVSFVPGAVISEDYSIISFGAGEQCRRDGEAEGAGGLEG